MQVKKRKTKKRRWSHTETKRRDEINREKHLKVARKPKNILKNQKHEPKKAYLLICLYLLLPFDYLIISELSSLILFSNLIKNITWE